MTGACESVLLNSGLGHYSRFCRRYACTDSGHLLEIHYKRIVVQRVWRLLPEVTIHTLALHDRFCVTGSEDGILRVWPLDFSATYMEAGERVFTCHRFRFVRWFLEHDGEVTALDISEDGMKILAGTNAVSVCTSLETPHTYANSMVVIFVSCLACFEQGNLGVLDACSKSYSTLMRSHAGHVTDLSVSRHSPGYLITCSSDHTIRVWDLPEGKQVSCGFKVILIHMKMT